MPYATEFSQLARFFPEPEERMTGGPGNRKWKAWLDFHGIEWDYSEL